MQRIYTSVNILVMGLVLSLAWTGNANAERISDIRNTKHNFSATVLPLLPGEGTRSAEANSESQICAFCHTPHGANQTSQMPLWNRKLSSATYIPYSSTSLDATDLGQPGGKSKLCLSCHDGTLALGAVNVLNGQKAPTIDVQGTGPGGTIPEGHGAETGFTRKLGIDLSNDHPISFTFDSAQAARDGELTDPATSAHVGNRVRGEKKPTLPLEDDKVECITCHDPHVRDNSDTNIKFLRVNRFQQSAPVEGSFDPKNDLICLACHDKKGWASSSHANPLVANESYQANAAQVREFPANTQVWQAACLNCHDPHTVQGSRRLLREGTDGPEIVRKGANIKVGGNPAIEETCYACHSANGNVLVGQGLGSEVPDIKTDFTTMARRMPISNTAQPAGREVHSIGNPVGGRPTPLDGIDFIEAASNLGKGDLMNRHVECTDCHNPHRVIQNRMFNADPTLPDGQGTHAHTAAQLAAAGKPRHDNIASGVLRGTWGVEPGGWPSTEFMSEPTTFDVKRGDPGVGGSTAVTSPYFTREYQLCMKCHSNYAYNTPPNLGSFSGGTPPGTNDMTQYTNQGMEYQSPLDHKGEGTSPTPSGAAPAYQANNHRAWHPVMEDTGRTIAVRTNNGVGAKASPDLWLEPFNMGVGLQTMYCTDCHGSDTPTATAVPTGGDLGNAWGPHGSNNDFLLKGRWDSETGNTGTESNLCFKCHDYNQYANINTGYNAPAPGALMSGFKPQAGVLTGCLAGPGPDFGFNLATTNLHLGHRQQVGNFRCTYCHIAVPHGWKNKNFLANLNDVGLEAGVPAGTQVRNNTLARYYRGPYYNGSVLKVQTFEQSGQWVPASCGSAGAPGNGLTGVSWMNFGSSETCRNLP